VIIALSISLLLCGCHPKRMSTNLVESNSTGVASVVDIGQSHSTHSAYTDSSVVGTTERQDIDVITTHTLWSAPDSLGRQYPRETVVTEVKKSTRSASMAHNSKAYRLSTSDSLGLLAFDTISHVRHREVSGEEKPAGHARRVVAAAVLSIGIILILILILKRFKLI